jgi:Ca2+-binding EF-hand superfamily protein
MFMTLAAPAPPACATPAELRREFALVDRNRDGLIDYFEFKDLLDGLEAQMTEHEMHRGLAEVDANRDGFIDCEEFLEWWLTD